MAVKKSARGPSGTKTTGDAAAGKKSRRERSTRAKSKKEGAVQTGARLYPEAPLPEQHLAKPGIEAELEPRPPVRGP